MSKASFTKQLLPGFISQGSPPTLLAGHWGERYWILNAGMPEL